MKQAPNNGETAMQLHEQYRPKTWAEVVGQEKAMAKINALRPRGLAGRAYWISGQSGTGKTTIGRLLAREVAEPECTMSVWKRQEVQELLHAEVDRWTMNEGWNHEYTDWHAVDQIVSEFAGHLKDDQVPPT
jgi:replication-associated recombination protein RarA